MARKLKHSRARSAHRISKASSDALEPKARRPKWDIDDGVAYVRRLEEFAGWGGFHVGLLGSVLHRGSSNKDIDVVVYPHNTSDYVESTESLLKRVRRFMERSGAQLIHTAEEVQAFWRKAGSADKKLVEVYEHNGRRVDVFVMR